MPGSYLFAEIGRRVKAYTEANPDKSIIRLGIGDVTPPLAPAIVKALHEASDEMSVQETFQGVSSYEGYGFFKTGDC